MLEYFIYCYGNQVLNAVLCAIFGVLGYAMKRLYARYVDDDTKQAVAKVAAQFVEQVWSTLHGAEKLQKALETAEAMLKKKGITFDTEEMTVLIEAAVAEFNEAFKKTTDTEETVSAIGYEYESDCSELTVNCEN